MPTAQRVTTARQEVDKKLLYGKFQEADDRRARFAERVAHKAADLALEDPMNITNTRTGIGTLGAIGIASVAGLPSLLLAGVMGWNALKGTPAPTPPPVPAVTSPSDSEYEIRFYNDKGELIDVPRKAS